MSLLEQDIIKKKQINKLFLESELKFNANNNKKQKIKVSKDNIVYIKEVKKYLSNSYYLIFWKSYLKKKRFENFFLQLCIFRK